ncbi:glycosyltransferase family 2 protein [Xanthocytophaga agilis]|uniref:Glycosyltransferase n=1 Tax=Xanthocytophaga agilis TaxID=3048010 RepID=A0AAE3R9S0_9BACT|nr:glycosyltransferase [Xanthocytophaga agilis]MDJ1504100.1 glycosyltransferase [Xanthocytophaga agilis]
MKLSIIIPTKDRPQLVIETLTAVVRAVKKVDNEILVVNDSEKPLILPDALTNVVTVLRNPKAGVASARNFGAKNAIGELLLFIDDDMLIQAEDIQTTLGLHQKYQRCCINLNWIYPPERSARIAQTSFGRYLIHYGFTSLKGWNRGNDWNDEEIFVTHGITSQYLSMTKKDFEESGGYNEIFPHAGFEDYEFAKRLQALGFIFYIYPKSRLFHNESDRLDLNAWLDRRRRGGATRKVAVGLGYQEVAIYYSFTKKIILNVLSFSSPLLQFVVRILPNKPAFDSIHFRIVNILLAVAIYEGYNSKK